MDDLTVNESSDKRSLDRWSFVIVVYTYDPIVSDDDAISKWLHDKEDVMRR